MDSLTEIKFIKVIHHEYWIVFQQNIETFWKKMTIFSSVKILFTEIKRIRLSNALQSKRTMWDVNMKSEENEWELLRIHDKILSYFVINTDRKVNINNRVEKC